MLLALIEAHVVEDEELGLGAEISSVGDSRRAQVHLRLAGDVAGIAVIALLGDGIDDVGDHHQSGRFGEGIHHVGGGIGDQQHVALVDGRPAADGGTVHAEALFE